MPEFREKVNELLKFALKRMYLWFLMKVNGTYFSFSADPVLSAPSTN